MIAILDGAGQGVSGDAEHLTNINPFRYRGYYYDNETGFLINSSAESLTGSGTPSEWGILSGAPITGSGQVETTGEHVFFGTKSLKFVKQDSAPKMGDEIRMESDRKRPLKNNAVTRSQSVNQQVKA